MKDYRLEIKIKNNYLYEKMQEYGISTAAELARVVGLGPSVIGDILNLKVTPYTNKGTVRSSIQCLCDFFSCNPEDLFPAQHIFDPLTVNRGAIQANIGELMSNTLLESTQNPDLLAETIEQKEAIERTLNQLTLREKKVLELRFGLGEEAETTLKEVGIKLGVRAERIRQIEAKALRKLRHPDRTRDIRLAYDGEELSEKEKREEKEEKEAAAISEILSTKWDVFSAAIAHATHGDHDIAVKMLDGDHDVAVKMLQKERGLKKAGLPPTERPYVERNRDTRLEYKAWQERVKKYGLDEALRQTASRQKGTH